MDLDLSRAMRDAARTGTAHRPALAPAPVIQRIRRRRRVRVATESTVGVAAEGAVAFGTLQALEGRGVGPVPPATPTSWPTGTPSPTATPSPAPGDFGCGLPVPGIVDPAGTTDLRLDPEFTVAPADGSTGPIAFPDAPAITMAPTERLLVDAALVNGSDTALDAARTVGTEMEVWITADDVVVGRLVATSASAPAASGLAPDAGQPGSRWSLPQLAGVPRACADDGTLVGELSLGNYGLYVVHDLASVGATDVQVADGPYQLDIVAPPSPPAPGPGTDPGADAHPAVEDLVVSPAGLGPLAVGRPPEQNPGAAMAEFDPDFCDMEGYEGDPGRWVASGYEPQVIDGEPRPPFTVDADEDGVHRIDVRAPQARTAEGVGLGTSLTELQATYADLQGPFDGVTSRVWWLSGPTGTLVFETQGDDDGLQPAGTPEQVIIMRVLAKGIDPAFATANTDFVAGGCM